MKYYLISILKFEPSSGLIESAAETVWEGDVRSRFEDGPLSSSSETQKCKHYIFISITIDIKMIIKEQQNKTITFIIN